MKHKSCDHLVIGKKSMRCAAKEETQCKRKHGKLRIGEICRHVGEPIPEFNPPAPIYPPTGDPRFIWICPACGAYLKIEVSRP